MSPRYDSALPPVDFFPRPEILQDPPYAMLDDDSTPPPSPRPSPRRRPEEELPLSPPRLVRQFGVEHLPNEE